MHVVCFSQFVIVNVVLAQIYRRPRVYYVFCIHEEVDRARKHKSQAIRDDWRFQRKTRRSIEIQRIRVIRIQDG